MYSTDDFTVRSIRELVEYDSSIEERYIPLILFLLGEMIEEFNVNVLLFNLFSGGVRERVVLIEFVIGRIEHFDELSLW
jgi:hypothetical protein